MAIQDDFKLLSTLKANHPLVHHITNTVTMNDCANITLAIGGSPVMTSNPLEVEEMVSHATALVVNIGTLSDDNLKSIYLAGKKANELNIPIILDPVGVGATSYRKNTVKTLLKEIYFTVIKGNMSEIKTLAGLDVSSKGVDATADTEGAKECAFQLAQRLSNVIVITAKEDIVSDGHSVCSIHNGHQILASVTGTGCMTASLIGCFSGISTQYFSSAILGTMTMGIAGEKAHSKLSKNEGIGTFKVNLMDHIYLMDEITLKKDGVLTFE
jgi:hydroxyethylthiazole kinase